MWDYYRRTLPAVQLVAVAISYMVYQSANRAWIPTMVFFFSMQVSAVLGAMWANRIRRKIQSVDSCILN
jgi:hypothetical protein